MSSLVADYGESSAESSNDSEAENVEEKPEKPHERLPPPTFNDKIKNSVFVNPFLEAENAKFALLEKHVKMVPQSNGKEHKKVCWMFKKGNCRFGKKCKFVHGEDTATPANPTPPADPPTNYVQYQGAHLNQHHRSSFNPRRLSPDRTSDEDEPLKKKKRPGLTQGLIPGKRVMAMYRKQKEFSH